MNGLGSDGLSHEQLVHFAEHGWVLFEGVLDEARCQAYIEAIDRGVGYYVDEDNTDWRLWMQDLHLHGDLFLDWYKLPGMLTATRQLIDVAKPRVDGTRGVVTKPHPDRETKRAEVLDPDKWGWHRDFNRPQKCLFPHPDDPDLVTTAVLGNITYLTPASAANGSTGVLDGSHRLDGDYASLKGQCPMVQPEAGAGSVLMFAETLIHTATPVVSETTRYVMIHCFTAPWIAGFTDVPLSEYWCKQLRDEELRSVFAPPDYGDRPHEN